MSPSDVSKIITDEIASDWTRSNAHGLNLRKCLVTPERRLFSDARDNSPCEMWLVLEEKPHDRSGYKIVFDETKRQFGLATPRQHDRDVFLGYYGSFLETFDGM